MSTGAIYRYQNHLFRGFSCVNVSCFRNSCSPLCKLFSDFSILPLSKFCQAFFQELVVNGQRDTEKAFPGRAVAVARSDYHTDLLQQIFSELG